MPFRSARQYEWTAYLEQSMNPYGRHAFFVIFFSKKCAFSLHNKLHIYPISLICVINR